MREPGIYEDVDIRVYHSEEGISSSGIKLLLKCPKRYQHEYLSGKKREDKGSYKKGRLLHTLVLEPHKFDESFYVIHDKVNMATNLGKEIMFKAKQEAGGRTIVRSEEHQEAVRMSEESLRHPTLKKLGIGTAGKIEHSIYWDLGGVRLRARPDFFNDNVVIDLKTTNNLDRFCYSVLDYGYHRQAAMQLDGLQKIDGKKREFGFFVIETEEPFLIKCFSLKEVDLELGRKEYLEAASIYQECMTFNHWPGYDEDFEVINLPNWKKQGVTDE